MKIPLKLNSLKANIDKKKLFDVSVISPENWGQWERQFQQNSSLLEKQLTDTYK